VHRTLYRTPPVVTHFKASHIFDSLHTEVIYQRHTVECQQGFLDRKQTPSSIFYSPSSRRLRKANVLSPRSQRILTERKRIALTWASELCRLAHRPESLLGKTGAGGFLQHSWWWWWCARLEGWASPRAADPAVGAPRKVLVEEGTKAPSVSSPPAAWTSSGIPTGGAPSFPQNLQAPRRCHQRLHTSTAVARFPPFLLWAVWVTSATRRSGAARVTAPEKRSPANAPVTKTKLKNCDLVLLAAPSFRNAGRVSAPTWKNPFPYFYCWKLNLPRRRHERIKSSRYLMSLKSFTIPARLLII